MSKSYKEVEVNGTERHREAEKKKEAEVQRYKSLDYNMSDEGQKHLLQPSGAQTEGAK